MRLIDADELLNDLIFPTKQFEKAFTELINDAPTVDAEPIVRCKDCRYCSTTPVATVGAVYECLRFRRRFGITMHMMPTDFCSKGQRRPAK